MKKNLMRMFAALLLITMVFAAGLPVFAEDGVEAAGVETADNTAGNKALAAAITVGLAAATGAISMGWAISKSAEAISRQPEVESKIRTSLMLGLVFIETAIIYALVVAILIIFVL